MIELTIIVELVFHNGSTMESKLVREFNSMKEMSEFLAEDETPLDYLNCVTLEDIKNIFFKHTVQTVTPFEKQ